MQFFFPRAAFAGRDATSDPPAGIVTACRMIVVVFALPEESREFRRAIGAVRQHGGWMGQVSGRCVRVEHCGVGPAAAAHAAAALLAREPLELLVVAGFAGALAPDLAIGDLVLATNFSTPAILQRTLEMETAARPGALVTVEHPVETIAAKRTLAASSGAIAVDMETAPLAAACTRADVPLLAIRVISDRADEPLPVPFSVWFDLTRQRPRILPLLTFLARHPGRIRAFARFVHGLRPAREALARFLITFLTGWSADDSRRCSGN